MNRFFIALIISFLLTSTTAISAEKSTYPEIQNRHTIHTIQSSILKQQRRYYVSLPEDYGTGQHRYPVLYVIDGDFHYRHTAAVAEFLAKNGKTPDLIVVGINNEGNMDYRRTTTTALASDPNGPWGKTDAYRQFISNELMPAIASQFRTNDYNMLSGYSLGGYFTLTTLFNQPDLFNAYLAFSPSGWFDDYRLKDDLARFLKSKAFNQYQGNPIQLYITLANEQGMGVAELEPLLAKQTNKKLHWHYQHLPDETHYSMALPALHQGLMTVFDGLLLSREQTLTLKTASGIVGHYEALAKKLGYMPRLNWMHAYNIAPYFLKRAPDQAQPFLDLVKATMPDSWPEFMTQFAIRAVKSNQPELAKLWIQSLQTAQPEYQSNPFLLQAKAQLNQQQGQLKQATLLIEKALAKAEKQHIAEWQYMELKSLWYDITQQ